MELTRKSITISNSWKLNNIFNPWIKESISGNKKYISNEIKSKNAIYNLWDTVKVLRGKYIAPSVHIPKEEIPEINNLNSHLKNLEKKEKRNLKQEERRKELVS